MVRSVIWSILQLHGQSDSNKIHKQPQLSLEIMRTQGSPKSLPFLSSSPGAGCNPSVRIFWVSKICVDLEQAFKLPAFSMTNHLQSEPGNRRDPAMSRPHGWPLCLLGFWWSNSGSGLWQHPHFQEAEISSGDIKTVSNYFQMSCKFE